MWLKEASGGFDPPLDITFSLEESGNFRHSAKFANEDGGAEIPHFAYSGSWQFSREEDGSHVIAFKPQDPDESVLDFEVTLVADTMRFTDRDESTTLYGVGEFRRIK